MRRREGLVVCCAVLVVEKRGEDSFHGVGLLLSRNERV